VDAILCLETKLPNLTLKTRPKQLLGSLLLDIAALSYAPPHPDVSDEETFYIIMDTSSNWSNLFVSLPSEETLRTTPAVLRRLSDNLLTQTRFWCLESLTSVSNLQPQASHTSLKSLLCRRLACCLRVALKRIRHRGGSKGSIVSRPLN
jgi:hypothetical protein